MKLPVPINTGGKIFSEVQFEKATAGVIADTAKIMDKGNTYEAIKVFCSGCITSIEDKTSKDDIKNFMNYMPYESAINIALEILLLDADDDGIEGVYQCPRCSEKIVCEKTKDDDTRDFINDLKVIYNEEDSNIIEVELDSPVEQKIEDEDQVVSKLTIEIPTLRHCIKAFNRYGDKDTIRLQMAIMIESMQKYNNIEVDNKWKSRWGMRLFEKISRKDLNKITDRISQYGVDNRIMKRCNKCGKEFKVALNTSAFFVLSLQ